MNKEPIRPSEKELLVFISSRQDKKDEEMVKARALAIKTVKDHDGVRVWAFEDAPASSEQPRDRYIRVAGKASFLIWLIGSSTTEAIVDEIDACMRAGGKILAFKLPANERDVKTVELIERVSAYATWRTVEIVERLPDHIRAALTDEIIKGFNDPAPWNHDQFLRQKKGESIADSKRLWATLDVPEDIAKELAEDHSVGHKLEPPTSGVLRITATQGSGKTLAAHRLYQQALDSRTEDHFNPFPIYLRARSISRDLKDHVEDGMGNQGTPYNQAILLIIDGLDEVGKHDANRILDEAASFTDANHRAAVVAMMRPLPGLKSIGETAVLPECTEDEFLSIASITAGRPVKGEKIPHRIFRTRLPLFAVILGVHLRNAGSLRGTTPSQMVELLVQRILHESDSHPERTEEALKKLAVAAIASGESVHKSEVDPSDTVQRLIGDSRLITEQGDRFDFALAIFREWFAAKALLERTIAPEEVALASSGWVVPIAIALNSGTTRFAHELMRAIVSRDPGLAGFVLDEVRDNWSTTDLTSDLPPGAAVELGHSIRDAMNDWKEGLGPLIHAIGPTDRDGNIPALSVQKGTRLVTTRWYQGEEELDKVVEIPETWEPFSYYDNKDWYPWRSTAIEHTKVWPWTFTHESLSDSLKEQLENFKFALDSEIGIHEFAAEFAGNIDIYVSSNREQARNSEIVKWIEEWMRGANRDPRASIWLGGHRYTLKELELLQAKLSEPSNKIRDPIEEPWPSKDKPWPEGRTGVWWSELYSEEQILKRTNAVFNGALRIYNDIVERWLSVFNRRDQMTFMLPLRLEGEIRLPVSLEQSTSNPPTLIWWPRFVDNEAESGAFFEMGSWERANEVAVNERLKNAREGFTSRKLGFFHSIQTLRVNEPKSATKLAHDWLTTDLRSLRWL